ncbi:unnamed protein product [Gongylonema pulchrum]|uniref:Myosin motor domain-containing protein n=1 Tax=Gongylonema pulchrum TaxID=637853 RepID=A0A183ECC3_9BILA|nr:unnamed protein product [Gongylonema pulchrum]
MALSFAGSSVLIAVNPYMKLPIYSAEQIRLYRTRRIGELPPHIFALACAAFQNSRASHHDQCIVMR